MSIDTVPSQSASQTAAAQSRPKPPYRVAIVGAGFIADYHAEILAEIDEATLVAVCDPVISRARALQSAWQIEHACSSIEELLEIAKPDVVHVLTPPATHFDVTTQILQAGVSVLLEKPMTLSAADAKHLAGVAQQHTVTLAVNHNWGFQPLFQRALKDIADRKIGPVRHVVSINSLPLFQLLGGQHDHWMFAEPTNVLFEQAPHPFSQIVHLTGPTTSVKTQWSGKTTLRGGKPFFSDWQFSLQGERATAQVHLGFGRAFADARLHILGVDGTIHIDQLNDIYTLDRRTTYLDAGDRFVRGLQRAKATAGSAVRGITGYATSLLGLSGRKDVYYLGMKESLLDFYRQFKQTGAARANLDASLEIMDSLQLAVDQFDEPDVAVTPAVDKKAGPSQSLETTAGKTLVIGGTGFIGRHLLKQFAMAGLPVRVLARSPRRIEDITSQFDIEVARGDVLNKADVAGAAEGCDTIVHLVAGAPEDWAGFEKLFIGGLQNTIDVATAGEPKRLVYASSIASLFLGDPQAVVTDDTPVDHKLNQRCDYAKAKILCEQLIEKAHRERGLPYVIMRPGIVIGEGTPPQHLGVGEWPSDIECVRWGRDTTSPMPLVLAQDVADAFVKAATAPLSSVNGKAFNLVGDVRLSADEYVDELRQHSDRDFQIHRQSVTYWTMLELAKWGIKAVARKPNNVRMTKREVAYRTGVSSFDTSTAKAVLDWQPEADRDRFVEKGIRGSLS